MFSDAKSSSSIVDGDSVVGEVCWLSGTNRGIRVDPLDGFGILVLFVLDIWLLHCFCAIGGSINLSLLVMGVVWIGKFVEFSCEPCSFSAMLGRSLQIPLG